VKDSSGNSIGGATISVNDSNNDSTTTDPTTGNYSLSIPSGIYNVQVTPATGSSFSSAIAFSQNISVNTSLNFILTPSGTVTMKGHIYDELGNPVPNQVISFNNVTSTTDSSGNYSISVAPSTNQLQISYAAGNPPNYNLNVPNNYTIQNNSFPLTKDITLDITLPARKVTVHVQDSSNSPLNGAVVNAGEFGNQTFAIGGGFNGTLVSASYINSQQTDSSGNTVVWLFPVSGSNFANFSVTPPSGSALLTTTLSNAHFTTDTTETVTMQLPVTLSGHVFDAAGNPVPNQIVSLDNTSSTTDLTGSYSITVAPGSHQLQLSYSSGNPPDYNLNIPDNYLIQKNSFTINQNTSLDFTLPAKKVTVQALDSLNNSVNGVVVNAGEFGEPSVSLGNSITGTLISGGYNFSQPTDSSGNTVVWLFPTNGNSFINFTANPPTGSNYLQTSLNNIHITVDTTKTIIMQQQPVTLSGHVNDASGNPLPGQVVSFGNNTSTTDASGAYSITVAPSTQQLQLTYTNSSNTLHIPTSYLIQDNSYTLSQNTTLNFTLPAKKVIIHVQDPLNNAVSGAVVSAGDFGEPLIALANNINGTVISATFNSSQPTDNSGNTTVWLFPTSGNSFSNFIITPPSGSIYNTFNLNNIAITGDQTEVVALQYNHQTPVTTASLSPTPFSDGTYADPTTVTLSASAASGFSVASTHYTIDGGSQQIYTTPFTATGAGSHTITYWSVDNSGVPETANTKTFTITESYSLTGKVYNDVNKNGFQDTGENGVSGAVVTLNTGQSTTTDSNGNYTFSNLESGTYIDTLTVPSGYTATTTNPATVALSANTTENFGIAQASSLVTAINAGGSSVGSFAADTGFSGGSTYSSSATVDTSGVTNPAPQAVYQTVRFGNFTYTVPNLTPNTAYTLRLHFNEVYFGANGNSGGVGSRVFNVSVNGTTALSNFDIYQTAGGANKAVVEEVPATSDSNGNITVQFTSIVDNAMVNGIEVDSGSPATTPTPTPTPITSEAINAGGDTEGSFVSDIDSTGGSTFSTTASIDTTGVTSPAPESVYQTVRYGNFTYNLSNFAPNSSHTVRLHFSELYWGTALSSNQGGDGSRIFNVSINGTQVLTNFDVYATAGGADKAVIEEFPVTADSNGKISIQFTTVTDNAMVSGIEVN